MLVITKLKISINKCTWTSMLKDVLILVSKNSRHSQTMKQMHIYMYMFVYLYCLGYKLCIPKGLANIYQLDHLTPILE